MRYSAGMPPKRDLHHDLDPRAPYAETVNRALRAPDPTLSWTGDPDLFMVWNRLENRWEVWRVEASGDRCLVRAPAGDRLDTTQLIRGLVERDSTLRNHKPVLDAVNEHNASVERERDRQMHETTSDMLERVYHALAQETGHQYGYVKPISLSGMVPDPPPAGSFPLR